jgi:hypothetical protein
VSEPTPASTWYAASGALITDRLLEWPPDLFALTNVVLARAEAFRYALSADWPPRRFTDWAQAVEEARRRWSAWAEHRSGPLPELVADEWRVFCQGAEVPIEEMALGQERRVCEALLTLHAVADEACAGLGVALDSSSTGRKKLIMAALWTEVCLVSPALDALRDGFEVYPVVDAVGGTSPEAHRAGLNRIVQAGARPIGWLALAGELQRDWARAGTVADVVDIVLTTRLLASA